MRLISIVAVLLLALVTGVVHASALVLKERQDVVALGLHTDYLLDHDHTLTLADVRSAPSAGSATGSFTRNTEPTLNFGFTQARIWLRFQIDNPLDVAITRILDVRFFMLDNITLYVPDDKGNYQSISNGRLNLQLQGNPESRFYHYRLTFAPRSQNTYYMALNSGEAIGLPIMLSTPEQQRQYQLLDTLLMTLYGSVILSTLFFALFMLASLRERELLYYVLFLCSHHLIALMAMEGVPSALFGITNPYIIRDTVPLFIATAILFAVLFMRNFLDFKTANPALYRFSHWMVAAMSVAVALNFIAPHYYAMYGVTVICMFVGTGILGATIYGLKVFELLPVSVFSNYSWHVGTMFEAVLFSFTIAQRVNTERKQRLQTQTELVEHERALRLTQEQLLQTETEAKAELETRVWERTRDIARILSELENEKKVLLELSINDGLTRVRNRRFFNDIYPQMWNDALEQQHWLSIILVDIDHFKAINDQHGHLMGDHCLVTIAGVLKQLVSRPTDVVCRYGGEEFVLLLWETDMESARWVAERIRRKISETTCKLNDQAITLTASFGVAGTIPEKGLDPMKLIGVCDEALYRAKQEGRNLVMLAEKLKAPDNVAPINGVSHR